VTGSTTLKGELPGWALALKGLGYLLIALAAIVAGLAVFDRWDSEVFELQMLLAMAVTVVSGAYFFGSILIAIAEAARRNRPAARWRLWAQILARIGGFFSISIPCAFYGAMPAGLQVVRLMRSGEAASEPISPLDPELLQMVVITSWPFFVIGLVLVVPALIWGRRSTVDISDVFA
jgi:hypothetical protein